MNTPTFQRIYAAELSRTGSANRALGRAIAVNGFLASLARPIEEVESVYSRGSYFRHKAVLHRAGISPIETPVALAAIARDLKISDRRALAHLVWSLNTDRRTPDAQKKSFDAATAAFSPLLDGALEILEVRSAA